MDELKKQIYNSILAYRSNVTKQWLETLEMDILLANTHPFDRIGYERDLNRLNK